jgi:Fe-S-cluster-containing hydrogenase component 2
MLNKTGVASKEMVKEKFPDESTLKKPKAILECFESIPCNPCETACPFGAIIIGENINNKPTIDNDACTGCAICVTACPGVAIFVAQLLNNKAIFKIPYEFTPIPKKGQIWDGLDREGNVICDATIEHVLLANKQDHTAVVTVSVDSKYLYDFITVREKHE